MTQPGTRGVDVGGDDERVGALDGEHPAADERHGGAPGELDLEDLRHRPSLPDAGWHARAMTSVLWVVGAVVVCLGLLYVAYSIEPHWVAKDGRRFLATSEIVDRHGTTVGRRREVRGSICDDGTVVLGKRALMRTQPHRVPPAREVAAGVPWPSAVRAGTGAARPRRRPHDPAHPARQPAHAAVRRAGASRVSRGSVRSVRRAGRG